MRERVKSDYAHAGRQQRRNQRLPLGGMATPAVGQQDGWPGAAPSIDAHTPARSLAGH